MGMKVSPSEAARLLGVSRQCFAMWVRRRHYNGFPRAIPEGGRHVYDIEQVIHWRQSYTPKIGRPKLFTSARATR